MRKFTGAEGAVVSGGIAVVVGVVVGVVVVGVVVVVGTVVVGGGGAVVVGAVVVGGGGAAPEHVSVPESVNVLPATGTNCQSYDAAWRVSFKTPKVVAFRISLFALAVPMG